MHVTPLEAENITPKVATLPNPKDDLDKSLASLSGDVSKFKFCAMLTASVFKGSDGALLEKPGDPVKNLSSVAVQKDICNTSPVLDPTAMALYSVVRSNFYGFDNPTTIATKVRSILKAHTTFCILIYNVHHDDVNNTCARGKFPLTTAARNAFDNT
ncbi:uncharacterized protein LOC115321064 [Ixodes scapularis]|uniref:uncharacterized protein LOC115321064 n=1 Tax=Ixodes scapularis TaxID=6945 RepID=UPI001A9DE876|nr:uncharacterized protein LOC115321064 [Ixodes scapularis]